MHINLFLTPVAIIKIFLLLAYLYSESTDSPGYSRTCPFKLQILCTHSLRHGFLLSLDRELIEDWQSSSIPEAIQGIGRGRRQVFFSFVVLRQWRKWQRRARYSWRRNWRKIPSMGRECEDVVHPRRVRHWNRQWASQRTAVVVEGERGRRRGRQRSRQWRRGFQFCKRRRWRTNRRHSASTGGALLVCVVNEMAARTIRTETNGVEGTTQLRFVLRVARKLTYFVNAVCELTLITVLACAILLEWTTKLRLVSARSRASSSSSLFFDA